MPTYGTFFGGDDAATAVCVDQSGNVIVVGYTSSQTLPGTTDAFQPMKAPGFPDNVDVFIAKFDPTGHSLLWASFLGGGGDDRPIAAGVDSSGAIYVTGTTTSSNLAVTAGAYLSNNSTPGTNGFAAKITPDGTSLVYLTYLPGTPEAFAVSGSGDAYIGGLFLPSIITAGAVGAGASPIDAEDDGVFLLRLNSDATGIVFCAYLGGGGFNGSKVNSVATDQEGNVYVAGSTTQNGENVLVTPNAFQGQLSNGPQTGFIIEVDPTGSRLLYGTYFGPQYSTTQITNVMIDSNGVIYFLGAINTDMLLATQGAYLAKPSPGFVASLAPGKATLDSFSFVDSNGAISFVGIGNQPKRLYVACTLGGGVSKIVELSLPSLGLASSSSFPQGTQNPHWAPLAGALAPPNSLWLTGPCDSCSVGDLISTNAYQTMQQSSGSIALIQLMDISPSIGFVASSATGTLPFSAGQLISIYGTQLGRAAGSAAQVGPDGQVTTTNADTQVLFDGVAAPLLYVGANQVNTVIPCAVSGHSSTQIVVQNMGAQSAPITIALSAAAPGIFTDDGTGRGQGAILNQDYSLNSSSNPAVRGSYVTFYATGVGPTFPCMDGQIYQSNFPTLTLPVVVGVGNSGVQVTYAGQAPDLISGVAQFNIVIPNDAPTGAVPLTLVVDGIFSPSGVTISVK